jgi:hypothetical protein
MNRNLLVFALLLIFAGFGVGFYLISFFGLLLLIPALLSPTRIPTRPTPTSAPSSSQPRRITPTPFKQPETAMKPPTAAPTPATTAPPSYEQQAGGYAPALFPTTMFPSLSGMTGTQPPPPKEREHAKSREQDEVLEVGGLLVLLRLLSG